MGGIGPRSGDDRSADPSDEGRVEFDNDIPAEEYSIHNVERGEGYRRKFVYATLHDRKGIVISATLDYIIARAFERGYRIKNLEQVLRAALEDI